MKYRKKPVVIEAFQLTPETRRSNADWPVWAHQAWQLDRDVCGALYPTVVGSEYGRLSINTLEGEMLVSFGDYIIQGIKGEIYPCREDIFAATYESVDA